MIRSRSARTWAACSQRKLRTRATSIPLSSQARLDASGSPRAASSLPAARRNSGGGGFFPVGRGVAARVSRVAFPIALPPAHMHLTRVTGTTEHGGGGGQTPHALRPAARGVRIPTRRSRPRCRRCRRRDVGGPMPPTRDAATLPPRTRRRHERRRLGRCTALASASPEATRPWPARATRTPATARPTPRQRGRGRRWDRRRSAATAAR